MHNLSPITIIKASGTKEPFSEEKVINSLIKSGLSHDVASQTVDYLKRHLNQEMSTGSIYDHISSYLLENAPIESYFNYGLRRAVMDMGPSGYPFEILISDLLRHENFKTEVGVVTQGKCITHEIDVIARKGEDKYFVECKFHNTPGFKTDVQVALYTYARFLDIHNSQKQNNPAEKNHPWLITNTKVTTAVLDYSRCVDLMITTWNYPKGGLQDMLVSTGLRPITLLHEIPKNKIKTILDLGIVTCIGLKTAILNNRLTNILDQKETSQVLNSINKLPKSNE